MVVEWVTRPGNGQAASRQAGFEQVGAEPLACLTQTLGRGSMTADTV